MNGDTPIDPSTGRAIIGGRARKWTRARALIPVVTPYGNLVHLLDINAPSGRWLQTLCGAGCNDKVTVATSIEPLCSRCAKKVAP